MYSLKEVRRSRTCQFGPAVAALRAFPCPFWRVDPLLLARVLPDERQGDMKSDNGEARGGGGEVEQVYRVMDELNERSDERS